MPRTAQLFTNQGRRRFLTGPELTQLQRAGRQARGRQKLITLALTTTGARLGEVLNLCQRDFDFEGRRVRIPVSGESLSPRTVTLERHFAEAAEVHFAGDPFLASRALIWDSPVTAWRLVKDLMAAKKITGAEANANAIRHGWALQQLRTGRPAEQVAADLGISFLTLATVYLPQIEQESIGAAVERLSLSDEEGPGAQEDEVYRPIVERLTAWPSQDFTADQAQAEMTALRAAQWPLAWLRFLAFELTGSATNSKKAAYAAIENWWAPRVSNA